MARTTFLLIRHGNCEPVGKYLAGRLPGISLNEEGRRQSEELLITLKGVELNAIYSSPLERALETATPLAQIRRIPITPCPSFSEVDWGEWTGRTIEDMKQVPDWRIFHGFRSGIRIPGGEFLIEVQARAVAELERLRLAHPDQTVAIFSHSDIIRAALLHYMGAPLENLLRLEIPPASVSTMHLSEWGPQFGCIAQRR